MPLTEFQLFRNPLLDNLLAKKRYIDYSERLKRWKNISKTPAGRQNREAKKGKDSCSNLWSPGLKMENQTQHM